MNFDTLDSDGDTIFRFVAKCSRLLAQIENK